MVPWEASFKVRMSFPCLKAPLGSSLPMKLKVSFFRQRNLVAETLASRSATLPAVKCSCQMQISSLTWRCLVFYNLYLDLLSLCLERCHPILFVAQKIPIIPLSLNSNATTLQNFPQFLWAAIASLPMSPVHKHHYTRIDLILYPQESGARFRPWLQTYSVWCWTYFLQPPFSSV